MVSSSRQIIACILFLLSAAICLQSQTVPAKVSTATITGKVTLKGKGIGGIVVGLRRVESYRQEGTLYQDVTDDQGIYRISNVQLGSYQVMTSAPAFVTKEGQGQGKALIVNKEETIENIDFEVTRGGVITGKVTDADGRAIVEQEVTVLADGAERQYSSYGPLGGQTDDRGVYRIFGLPAGKYKVAVGQSGRGSLGHFGHAPYPQTFHPATSDISQATAIDVAEGSEVADVDITIGRALTTFSVRGQIVDGETGRPVPNLPYGLQVFYDQNSSGSTTTGAVTNQAGEFRFENLTPGKYGISLEQTPNSDWRPEQARFEIKDQDVTGLVVRVEKGASVSGVVVLEGSDEKEIKSKLTRAFLNAWTESPDSTQNSGRSAQINPDGTFRISGLRSGLVRISLYSEEQLHIVRIEHQGVVQNNGVEIKPRETVAGLRIVVIYAGGGITGIVKLENGSLPPGTYVQVSARILRDDVDPMTSRSDLYTQADARGQFVFKNLLSGAYEVNVTAYSPETRAQFTQVKQQVVVTNGAVTNVTVTLEPNTRRP